MIPLRAAEDDSNSCLSRLTAASTDSADAADCGEEESETESGLSRISNVNSESTESSSRLRFVLILSIVWSNWSRSWDSTTTAIDEFDKTRSCSDLATEDRQCHWKQSMLLQKVQIELRMRTGMTRAKLKTLYARG